MDWKVFSVCLFAICASYLILMIPVSDAATVTIHDPANGQTEVTSYEPSSMLNRLVSVNSSGDVRVAISNTSSNTIESVSIFLCQSRSPSDCIAQVTPTKLAGNVDVSYTWSGVRGGASYPQTGNVMEIVNVIDAQGGKWLGFWTSFRKDSASAPYSKSESSIANMEIVAKSMDKVPVIKRFIELNEMLPMNPGWISSIIFSGMAGFYDIGSDIPPAAKSETYSSSNSKGSMSSAFAFIFPQAASTTYNGITIANSSDYIIGDGICSLGEADDQLGCRDCGTPAGWYCDTLLGAKPLSQIRASVTSSGQIKISNCNIPNTFGLSIAITSLPSGASIESAQYRLNGTGSYSASCQLSGGNVFTCGITTPAIAGCTGANYLLDRNSITVNLRFGNGSSTMSLPLSVAFPNIAVGSWTCGQYGCEASLGESQDNCCTDCGCPAGKYCDAIPGSNSCKPPPSALQIYSAAPSSFFTHNAASGDYVSLELRISNPPSTIAPAGAGCRISDFDCVRSGMPCTASCTVACPGAGTASTGAFNASCTMNFRISGYDQRDNYSVQPTVNYSFSYSNKTEHISGILEAKLQPITITPHWKGDGKCDPDESASNDCFDCGCAAGSFCNTTGAGYDPSDSCIPASAANITIDSVGGSSFTDSVIDHSFALNAHSNGKPAGFFTSSSCKFNGTTEVPCYASCTQSDAGSSYNLSCRIGIPAIDYRASSFYSAGPRRIIITGNSLHFTSSFNNGSSVSSVAQDFALPDITIGVIPHCGDGVCSSDISEDASNCCIDCGCARGSFCYSSYEPRGQCLNSSETHLLFDSTDPKNLSCTILQMGKECVFTNAIGVKAHIYNPPSGMVVGGAMVHAQGIDHDAICVKGVGSNYTCATVLENLNASDETKTYIPANMTATIVYRENGSLVIQNLSMGFSMPIDRVKSDYVKNCEQEIATYKKQIKDLDNTINIVIGILAGLAAIDATFWILYAVSCEHGCNPVLFTIAWKGLCIIICVSGAIIPMILEMMDKIKTLEKKKQSTCNTDSSSQLNSDNDDSVDMSKIIVTIVMLILCVVCMLTNPGGGTGSSGGGGGTPSATPGSGGGSMPASGLTTFA